MNARAADKQAGAFMRNSVCGLQALLFLHDSIDRTALLKRIAAPLARLGQHSKGATRFGCARFIIKHPSYGLAAEQRARSHQFLEFPFTNLPSLVFRYFSIVSMLLVWVRRDCPSSRIIR